MAKFNNHDGTIEGAFSISANAGTNVRSLKNNAGEMEIVANDGNTISTLKVATPTNAAHATTKAYVDGLSGGGTSTGKAVKLTVAFNSANPVESTFQVPNNSIITKVMVKINTQFDTAATIQCGLKTGSASQFLGSTDINLQSAIGTVYAVDLLELNGLGADKEVSIDYAPNGATAGNADVYLFFTESALT